MMLRTVCSIARFVSGVLMLAGFALAAQARDERPNILLIVSEDNSAQFGCYGDTTVATPHVDGLAAAGVQFTNAYVTQAVCSPSRSTIFTGLYPHQNGQIGLATHQFTMVREWPNLPQLLGKAGYRTGMLGKLHVNPESAIPFDFRWRDPQFISFAHRDVHRTAEVAAEFLGKDERPFFLMVNYADAHLPFLPQSAGVPEKPLTAADVVTPPAVGVDTPRLRGHTANYYNCMKRLDTGIGLLLNALEKSGRADNTLVIYVADHGMQFARGKVTIYELGLRVPLIVRWPGQAKAKLVRDELVSTIDLLPTILDAAGVAAPKNLPGRSLVPLVRGESPAWREYLFCEWNTSHAYPTPGVYFPQRSVRDGRYKLIVNLMPGGRNPAEEYYTTQSRVETGPTQEEIDAARPAVRAAYATWRKAPAMELYDLQEDPHEFVNLADRPELATVRERLAGELKKWQKETADPFADPENIKRLAAEHVEMAEQGRRTGKRDFKWRYPEYMYGER